MERPEHRSLVSLLFAAVALLALGAPGAGARPGPDLLYAKPPKVPALAGSKLFRARPLLVSGTDAYRHGEYLYQDYLYDDYGADTTPGLGASAFWASQPAFAPAAGDVAYPAGSRFRGNAADLVELRIRPTRRSVVYRVTLNTAIARNAAVVGIGIDTDRRDAAQVAWPRGAGVTSPGLDAFVTAWGTGGEVTWLGTGRTTRLPRGAVRMDLRRNQMTVTVSRRLLNPRHATWRYVAGTGLWSGHAWTRPSASVPGVFNLAFRFHEPVGSVHGTGAGRAGYSTEPGTGSWFEDGQARELGAGTTGVDHADINFGLLARRISAGVHRPGRTQARIYPSALRVPEGVNHASFPEFGGALQPYLVTLPPGYRRGRRTPLLFALHPSNSGYQPFDVFMPNLLRQLGGDRGTIVVTPLGRGVNGPHPDTGELSGAAEADFFEAWGEVRRRFTIDPSRVGLSGYSLGAYADYHLGVRFPDLFSSIFSVVGAPPTNGRDLGLLGNLRWIPVVAWNQADDALVPYTDARAAANRLQALGLRHEQWTFPVGNHLAPALRDDWAPAARSLGSPQVERDPSRVDFAFYPSLDNRGLRLVADHAYWISRVRASGHGPLARGDVIARSLAFGRVDPSTARFTRLGSTTGTPATIDGTAWRPAPRSPRANELDLTLHGVSSLKIDGAQARLSGRRALRIHSSSDRLAQLTLTWGRRHLMISLPPETRLTTIRPRRGGR